MSRWLRTTLLLACLTSSASAFASDESDLEAVSREISSTRDELDVVARGYGKPEPLEAREQLERRLREGEIQYYLKEYVNAATLLFAIAEHEEYRAHPRYPDALFLLADSLRHIEAYTGSKSYFEELLPTATGVRLRGVVVGLLEIALATRQTTPEDIDRYFARLQEAGGMQRPDIDYLHGKVLYGSGQLEPALTFFSAVPAGFEMSAQASYYAGVTRTVLGRPREAIPSFVEAIARSKASKETASIGALGTMALARLYHELGETEKAIQFYDQIKSGSSEFSDMLFEVAWTHVKAASKAYDPALREKSLVSALRSTEVLMAASPDHRLYPEARILEGNLQIQLGAPENAYGTFQSLIDRYGGAQQQLARLMLSSSDPKLLFEQIVHQNSSEVRSTEVLPPVVIEWALRSAEVRNAVGLLERLTSVQDYLKQARGLVSELNEALKGEQRYKLFRGLSEARGRAYAIENRVVIANGKLLDVEYNTLRAHVEPTRLVELEKLRARRLLIGRDVQLLPKSLDEVERATRAVRDQFTATERRVFHQGTEVESMRTQVAASGVWLAEHLGTITPERENAIRPQIDDTAKDLVALEAELNGLNADISAARALSGQGGGRQHAEIVRAEYNDLIRAEAFAQAALRPADSSGIFSRIDAERALVAKITPDLAELDASLDAQVEQRIAEVRALIADELRNLETYEEQEFALSGEADTMLGPVAQQSLAHVAKDFSNLVKKADLGLIDVAWARKRMQSKKVSEVVKAQTDRVQVLEASFQDILKEE